MHSEISYVYVARMISAGYVRSSAAVAAEVTDDKLCSKRVFQCAESNLVMHWASFIAFRNP